MSVTILNIISPGLKEEMELKPLDFGQTVEFRLTNAGVVDPSSTKGTATPQMVGIASRDMIKDTHDKQGITMKLIMNIDGYKPIQEPGKPVYMEPILKMLEFDSSGSIYCTPGDENKYYYAKLSNKNGTNINRIDTKTVKFKEIDETKEVTLKNNIFEYRTLASMLILNADDDENKLLDMAQKIERAFPTHYKFNLAKIADVKSSLAIIANTNTVDFIRGVKDEKLYTRLIVDDAVARRKVIFNEHAEHLSWNYRLIGNKPKGKEFIVKLDSRKNTVKGLVDFLLTADGSKHLIELKQNFEDIYQKPR